MSFYESVLIARQDLGASQVSSLVSDLSETIKKNGGEVVRVDNWGLKNLALRFNEDVIRYMTVKVDELSSEDAANSSSETSEEQEAN